VITLFLVPSLYLMLEDWLHFWGLDSSIDPALIPHNKEAGPVPTLNNVPVSPVPSGGGS
jgi:hypothetical protein